MGRKTFKDIVSVVLLALFCLHVVNITLFPHVHIVDGVAISHSHPYSGTADKPGHTHTSVQFDTIAQFSALLLLVAVFLGLSALFRIFLNKLYSYTADSPVTGTVAVFRLRGPPLC